MLAKLPEWDIQVKKELPKKEWAVKDRSDVEIQNAICDYGKCAICECLEKCEWGKEAVRRGLKKKERGSYHGGEWQKVVEGVPVLEKLEEGMITLPEICRIMKKSDMAVRYRIIRHNIKAIGKIKSRGQMTTVFHRAEVLEAMI